jgi:hypothetical protein
MFTDPTEGRSERAIRSMDVPFSFSRQSYPLNPGATVCFTLEESQEITLRIYDTYGRIIHTIYDEALMKPGYHELQLYGDIFPPGACYARLHTRYGVQQRSLILITTTYP